MRLRPCLAPLLAAGCTAPAGPEGGTGTGTTGGAAGPPPDPPDFLQPADGVLSLETTRHADVFLAVRNVVLGRTQLEIDGTSRGTLLSPTDLGHLEAQMLTLFMHGALAPGLFTMALATPSEETVRSRTIEIRIAPPDDPPAWTIAPSPLPSFEAKDLRIHGHGPTALVTYVAPDDTVRWFRPAADPKTSELDAPIPLPLPADLDLAHLAVTTPSDAPDARRLFVRLGPAGPGAHLDRVCLAFAGGAWQVTAQDTVLSAAADATGVEWVDLLRVEGADTTAFVERIAAADADAPAPGARDVLWVFAPCAGPVDTEVLPLAGGLDRVDVRPVLDPAALRFRRPPAAFSVFEGGVRPIFFEIDEATRTLRTRHAPPVATASPLPIDAAVLGGLDAVTTFSVESTGVVATVYDRPFESAAFVQVEALSAPPAGPPAAFVLEGWPALAVAHGPAAPITILASSGADLVAPDLGGQVPACDAIAAVPTYDGNLEGAVRLACRTGTTVAWYELAGAAP